MTSGPVTVLVIGGLPGSLVNFRGPLLEAMRAKNHTVFAAASGRDPDTEAKLREIGVGYCSLRMARTGMNPLADAATLADMVRLVRRVKPDVLLDYTIKPVIYGNLAARICGVRSVYSLVTGLGYAFIEAKTARQLLAGWMAKRLYRASLRYSAKVFFQNPDDMREFVNQDLAKESQCVVLNGSGVDLDRFGERETGGGAFEPERRDTSFLLMARLLKDKGIAEYADAARMILRKHSGMEFHLIGPFDPNPAGLLPRVIEFWEKEGVIRFHGAQSDVRPFLRQCNVYVLPSYYREGTPRTVLEAMAMGRAIITTDAPGCRETVRAGGGGWIRQGPLKIGVNGILVPPRDAEALAEAMEFFIQRPNEMARMGAESRRYAEERYDVHKVNAAMLEAMGL